MTIEIKKSVKPIKYKSAIDILEDRLEQIKVNKNKELIWILEHEEIYTGGTSFNDNEILDKSIKFILFILEKIYILITKPIKPP